MLQRDAGPSGWVDWPKRRYELDGWEVFEGDPASPHQCRGWFRCTAADFAAPKGSTLSLRLTREDGSARLLTVEIVRVKTTEPEWEFIATR
jgi:hypothetical protein